MSNRVVSREISLSDLLSLVAAPVFAVMALLSALPGPMDIICGSASPLTGMTAMYALMSVFHLSPWLRLLGGRLSAPQP